MSLRGYSFHFVSLLLNFGPVLCTPFTVYLPCRYGASSPLPKGTEATKKVTK